MSTTFKDGPAAGSVLMLARAPMMLRVVVDEAGKVDALDQLGDTPKEGESLFVYIMRGAPGATGFWDGRGKDGRRTGGSFASAAYRLCSIQPSGDEARTREGWESWCESNREQLLTEYRGTHA